MSTTSYKDRVAKFWDWFQEVAERFYDTIEAGRCEDLAPEVAKKLDEWFAPMAWVFGPGPDDVGGHSFTLSGDGNPHNQFLTEYWVERAPKISGWTFFPSRQPADLNPEHALRIGESLFSLGDMRFSQEVDEEQEVVHVQIYHPLFESLEEDTRLHITFLLLDEVLGEYGTGQWIGAIDTVTELPDNARPFTQLRDAIHDLEIEYKWQKMPPTQSGVVYRLEPSGHETFHRGDVVLGSTVHIGLIEEYIHAAGDYDNPLEDLGADFVYLELSNENLPSGSEAAFRGEIEDAINEKLEPLRLGHSLGGAFSKSKTYIDFLITDPAALDVLQREIESKNLVGAKAIRYFASDRGEAIEF